MKPATIPAAVVGMGLMGTSIVACLLAAGHPVTGITGSASKLASTRKRLSNLLAEMKKEGLFRGDPARALARFTISTDYAALASAGIVVESIIEDLDAKRKVLAAIEEHAPADAVIGTNTSAIPVSILQKQTRKPARILGLHWAEPAHITRFLEIVYGDRTAPRFALRVRAMADAWGKEPTVVKRDIRGFVANRIMYAMIREAFHLVESGAASIEDVDRSVRNDIGCWATLAGPFRWMDLTGIPAYAAVMRDLNPELSNAAEVPELMRKVVEAGGEGIANAKGFYKYTPAEAKRWEKKFHSFSYDIRALAEKYRR
ncbi:MAG TPA: 3-hydroxyacyl-CoA dehydrogenase family protein [Bryobacteraceae bacterium]|nr:3-hydroxyacyl-CoA dehydrogenase family protein [Bryobacteraceae bacterium]